MKKGAAVAWGLALSAALLRPEPAAGQAATVQERLGHPASAKLLVKIRAGPTYELAFKEKVFAAMAQLQWFLTEQVEEEKTGREIVAKFRLIGDDAPSILDMDRELGARSAVETAGEPAK